VADVGAASGARLSTADPEYRVSHLRRVLVAVVSCAIGALLVAVLGTVPLLSHPVAEVVGTADTCPTGPGVVCTPPESDVRVGNSQSARFAGDWTVNVTGGVLLTIGVGSPFPPGAILSGPGKLLYASPPGAASGTFSVSGPGPFYLVFAPALHGEQTTTLNGTICSTVL